MKRTLLALVALAALVSCSASAVRVQTVSAQALGVVGNRAEPAWIDAYRAEGRAAADAACPVAQLPAVACQDARLAAVRAVEDRWSAVAAGWEAVRIAHARWADRLDVCNGADSGTPPADGGTCAVELASLEGDALGAIASWRCAVRALARPDLDPFPGAIACMSPDAGVDAAMPVFHAPTVAPRRDIDAGADQ